jgi:SSS family solute:Na+ symporter
MIHFNAVTFTILIAAFALVTCIGFGSARWRPAEDLMHLNEWGLGGRGFGTFVSWFLLGGDIYTAYTFIAVPALVYATGAAGFYALSYTIMVFPIVFIFGPRLWPVVTSARVSSPAAGSVPRAWASRSPRPGSSPPCPTSRCSSSASSRC